MPVNTFVRAGGVWAPVGPVVPLPPPPEPEPDPAPRPPQTFTHGEQITRSNIGPSGTLTPYAGPTTLKGTVTITNALISEVNLTISAGANVTLRNCRLIGPPGASSYAIKATAGGGLRLTIEDCEIVARAATMSVRCIAMWGDGNLAVRRSLLRGGIDNVYLNPDGSPGLIQTDDPLVPMARVLIEDSLLCDLQRLPDSHTDCIQVDGGGYAVIRRNRIMCYSIPGGADPLTTTAADKAEYGSGGFILTQKSSAPSQISYVAFRRNWAEGGNITCDLDPPDGLPVYRVAVTGNRFGIANKFGALSLPDSLAEPATDNRWGESGTTGTGQTVTAGQPVPGSS